MGFKLCLTRLLNQINIHSNLSYVFPISDGISFINDPNIS